MGFLAMRTRPSPSFKIKVKWTESGNSWKMKKRVTKKTALSLQLRGCRLLEVWSMWTIRQDLQNDSPQKKQKIMFDSVAHIRNTHKFTKQQIWLFWWFFSILISILGAAGPQRASDRAKDTSRNCKTFYKTPPTPSIRSWYIKAHKTRDFDFPPQVWKTRESLSFLWQLNCKIPPM